MITLDALKEFGADTEKGLTMCMGNEALYLKLVSAVCTESRFDDLVDAVSKNDYDAAFDAAHALKGVLGNLSLTPMLDAASKITELLRARTDTDYTQLVNELINGRDALAKLCE